MKKLSEEMKTQAIKLDLLSIMMMEMVTDQDSDLYRHAIEVHGASKQLMAWSEEVLDTETI